MQPYRFMEVSMACTNVLAIKAKGARFTLTPALVREWQKKQDPGPDNLWIELNEVHEPRDAQWFPA